MKIFVAGATGAIGRTLVPLLLDRGHAVTGTTRSPDKADWLRVQGATAAVADGLDRDAMARAMQEAQPDTVVHPLTALGDVDFRRFERRFAQTNRLRTEGTDILLAGAREAGARRFVTQSFAGWPYGRSGKRVKTEDDQLDPQVPKQMRPALHAIRYM